MKVKIKLIALFFSAVFSQSYAQRDSISKEYESASEYDVTNPYLMKRLKRHWEIDSELDTSRYVKRKRFQYVFDLSRRFECNFNEHKIDVDTFLLKQLLLCRQNDTIDEFAYYMWLDPCIYTTYEDDIHVFTLDTEQKDSSVILVTLCDGDSEPRFGYNLGTFLVFKKEKAKYKLTDVGFGKISALDFDKQGRVQPLVCVYPKEGNPFDILEVRLAWDGKHLIENQITGGTYNDSEGEDHTFSSAELKKEGRYEPLANEYIHGKADILRGVKIHWRYNSYSLYQKKNATDPEEKKAYRKLKWTRGFRID